MATLTTNAFGVIGRNNFKQHDGGSRPITLKLTSPEEVPETIRQFLSVETTYPCVED